MGVVDAMVRGVGRTVSGVATATTAVAGAVGGAAINGVVGGVKGAAEGIQQGIGKGSKSTAAAALAIGALGVTGLVEWPILLAVGGGALVLRKMSQKPEESPAVKPPVKAKLTTVPTEPDAEEAAPAKTTSPRKAVAKKAAGRRAGSTELRSTN